LTREEAVVIDLKDVNLTYIAIAKKHGIDISTVRGVAKRHNILFRKPGRPWGSKSKKEGSA
jgi:hypothetical protein